MSKTISEPGNHHPDGLAAVDAKDPSSFCCRVAFVQMSPRKQEDQSASDEDAVFARALVGVDGSLTGRDAIVLANLILGGTGRLTLAHVVLNPAPRYQNFHSTAAGRAALEMLEHEREATGIMAELTGMFSASVGSGLHRLAHDCRADLLVVGSSSRGLIGRVLAGDDARGTVVGASCVVAVAPLDYAARAQPIKTVGVAYNATPEARAALAVGRGLATRHKATLCALTVVALAAAEGVTPTLLDPTRLEHSETSCRKPPTGWHRSETWMVASRSVFRARSWWRSEMRSTCSLSDLVDLVRSGGCC